MAKLLIAVVHAEDAGALRDALRNAELRITEVPSRGGFLQAGSMMVFIGLEDDQPGLAVRRIEESCRARTRSVGAPMGGMKARWRARDVTQGGATVVVLPRDEIRRI